MITIISPAKTLDFESEYEVDNLTNPDDLEVSKRVIKKLRTLSKKKLGALMNINHDLVEVNTMRYQEWTTNLNNAQTQPALLAFNGEVYRGLDAKSFSDTDLKYAQEHLRILSGLHGILRPLDRLQAYRLEMGTSIPVGRKKNLYDLWRDRVTERLNQQLKVLGTDCIINLASTEYSKVVDFKRIDGQVIIPVFKDLKNGEYKVVMTWAKSARGKMASYIIRNRIEKPEDLKGFKEYSYNDRLSTENEWVFTREGYP